MVKKRSTKMGKLMPYVDVRSEKDIPKFESMVKTGPVFVLVYADWCGHCRRFKQEMWDEVANSPNKEVNTAAVHYNMVDKTSMKSTPIEGYPTLFEVKPTPKANVSTPVKTPQNKTELENLVGTNNNTNVPTLPSPNNNIVVNNTKIDPSLNTMDPNMLRSQRMTQSSESAEADTFEPEPMESLPPPAEEPLVEENVASAPQGGGGPTSGGSLMETLLKISADSAHAIVLAGSAAELSRRWSKKRMTKKRRSSKKRQTKRK